jgi:nicotinamide riboside transporter PnuC
MVVLQHAREPHRLAAGLVSSLMYFALFWDSKLYGDASLQLVFASVARCGAGGNGCAAARATATGWRCAALGALRALDHPGC